MTERRIGWRDWTLVLVTLAIWVAMLAVCVMDVRRAESQVTIPGAAKGQVKVPIHAHSDIGNGGKIKARDIDWSLVESGAALGPCMMPCLNGGNVWTGYNVFQGTAAGDSAAITIRPQVPMAGLVIQGTGGALILGTENLNLYPAGYSLPYAMSVTAGEARLAMRVSGNPSTRSMTEWYVTGTDSVTARIGYNGAAHFTSDDGYPLYIYNGADSRVGTPRWKLNASDLSGERTGKLRDANMGYLMGTSLAQTMSGHNLFTVGTYLTDTLSVAAPALITGVFNATGIKQFANGTYFTDSVSITPATDVLPLRVTQHSGATADLTDWDASTGDRLAKIDPMGAGHFGDNSGVGTPLILYNGYADDASSSDVTFNVFGLTADRTITIPDGTGNMVITGVVSDFSGGTGSTLRSSTASSGAAFQDNTTSSKKLRVITSGSSVSTNNAISFTTASSRTFAFTDQVTPTVVLKTGTDGNHVNQTADIGSTTLVTPPAAGLYRVSYYLRTTTADITSIESVTLSVTYTDNVGSTTRTDPSPIALLSTNSLDAGSFVVYVASGSITYTAADGGGGYGSAAYELRIRAEAL